MDIQSLHSLLAPSLGPQARACLDRFSTEWPEAQPERYLAWLYEQKLIGFRELEQVLTHIPIETGHFPKIQERPLPYDFLLKLGQGAMGVVHLAKDRSLRRKVAYKQLLGQATLPVLRRFLNEVRITAQLEHPSIVPVYQLNLAAGERPQLSYSMKAVHGQTLKERLEAVRVSLKAGQAPVESLRSLLDIFLNVCDAMAYAHSRQVIHRDLKPANIMIGPYGDVYVMDWGIARCFNQSEDMLPESLTPIQDSPLADPLEQTQIGQILGTPRYMSPQQAAGKNNQLDGRSDQFALGLILYEILTLKTAMHTSNQIQLLKQVLKAELQPFEPFHPKWPIPPELCAIVQKATQRKPEGRYPDVSDLAKDIRRYLNGQKVSVYTEPLNLRLLRWLRQHRKVTLYTVLGLSIGSLTIIASSLLWQLWRNQIDSRRELALSRFLSLASSRAQLLDARFLAYQGKLEALSAAAQQALLQPAQALPQDIFQSPKFEFAPAYGQKISFVAPSLTLPARQSSLEQKLTLQQVQALAPLLIKAFEIKSPQTKTNIRQTGQVLSGANIYLPNGTVLQYPGLQTPAQHPLQVAQAQAIYQQAAQAIKPIWGRPYQSQNQLGLLLPLMASLRKPSGQLLGITSLELSLDRLLPDLLKLPEQTGVRQLSLLDAEGRVIVKIGNQAQDRLQTGRSISLLNPAELRQHSNGVIHLPDGSLQAYFLLGSLNWYYLIELETSL